MAHQHQGQRDMEHQPNIQIQRLPLNRLSKNVTSRNMRSTTPPVVVGAGVVGIDNGAGVRAISTILYARPTTNSAAAT